MKFPFYLSCSSCTLAPVKMKELTTDREGDTAISKPPSEVFSLWQWIIADASGEDASVL